MNKNAAVKVVQDPDEEPIPFEILAQSIKRIDDAVQQMKKAGLNRRAIVVLLAANTGCGTKLVNKFLDGLESLKKDYLNQ